MPIHDWTRVDAGTFHDFHHAWIEEIKRALNKGILPSDYYALAEQHAAGYGPDVLTLQTQSEDESLEHPNRISTDWGGLAIAEPKLQPSAETDMEFYRRKKNIIAVRHVSGDRVVAVIEIVSPGNKNNRHGLQAFLQKTAQFLDQGIHLLILDLLPPNKRNPHGIHAEIWDYIAGQEYQLPPDKPLIFAAYESDLNIRAYVKPAQVGEPIPDMPLFLHPHQWVTIPLESTYQAAFAEVPRRWRTVLESHVG